MQKPGRVDRLRAKQPFLTHHGVDSSPTEKSNFSHTTLSPNEAAIETDLNR
jgi:hypothetical protein